MKPAALIVASLAVSGFARQAKAQSAAESMLHDAPGADHLRAQVAMDPGFAVGLGYVRAVDVGTHGWRRRLGLHVDVAALIDFRSWDVATGATVRAWDRPGFDILALVDFDLKLAQNEVHTALSNGYRFGVRPGYFGQHWYFAAELALRGTISTTLWHTSAYREQFPEVRDGTYSSTTTHFFPGVVGGFRFLHRGFAGLRAAYRLPLDTGDAGPWVQPMTFNAELGFTADLF